MNPNNIDLRLNEFCNRLFDMHTASMVGTNIPDYYAPFSIEKGKKYARIVKHAYGSRSVYCFVDLDTGDVLKAASWKSPAKGKRASIWNDDCDVGTDKPCNVHGSGLYK